METIDEEITKASLDYLERAKKANKPFFLWWNSTRMHIWTHLKKESQGKTGLGVYPDGMVEHDAMVGQLLDKLKELGLDGQHHRHVFHRQRRGEVQLARWRHVALPQREGDQLGGRLSRALRHSLARRHQARHRQQRPLRPRRHAAHALAAAGVPDVKEQLLKGMKVGNKTFKVHLDGYNITDALAGKAPDPRKEFFYFNDDGSLVALRYDQWKIVFAEQRAHGFDVWQEPFTPLRLPEALQPALRSVRAGRPRRHRLPASGGSIASSCSCRRSSTSAQFLATFKEFPPSQKVGSFSLDDVVKALEPNQ